MEEEVRRRALSDIEERAKGLSEKLRGISNEEMAGFIRGRWGKEDEVPPRCKLHRELRQEDPPSP
ncbi:MAG: hypothetical protein QXG96_05645 [Candidatus Bathyarchaeia archaeon]